MKRLILLLMLCTRVATGALSDDTEWEVRTTGNDGNGGGFNTASAGVDRSQADAAFATLTTASAVHTTTTQLNVDSGDYTVSADDVGNLFQATSGDCTAGFYEITAADVGNNRWTVDRALGTSGQTCAGAMGGGLATLTKVAALVANNHIVWIKSGTYTETLTTTVAASSRQLWIQWRGYLSSHGDAPAGTDRPLIDGESTRANCIVVGHQYNYFAHLRATGATSHCFNNTGVNSVTWFNVQASACGGAGFRLANSFNTAYIDCESMVNTGAGFQTDGGSSAIQRCHGCVAADNGGDGFNVTGGLKVSFTISEGNTGNGFELIDEAINCTADGNGDAGFRQLNNTRQPFYVNNIASNNGTVGFVGGTSSSGGANVLLATNCYNNTTACLSLMDDDAHDLVTVLDPQYVDAAGNNFEVGANMKAIGAPGTLHAGQSYIDLGAFQREEPAGGGGGGVPVIGGGVVR